MSIDQTLKVALHEIALPKIIPSVIQGVQLTDKLLLVSSKSHS